jgi:hypothetical protein
MPNESIFPARRAELGIQPQGVTVFGGEDALVNVEPLKNSARDALTDIVGGVMQVVNKALPAALAACASVQFRGTQGSFMAFVTPIRLTARFISISDDRSDFIGYPCERVVALGQLAGFTLCENATISISGTVIEEEAIEDLLNKGVFIEA